MWLPCQDRLIAGLVDDHVELTAEERRAVHTQVMYRFAREPRAAVLRFVPGLIPLVMIPFWLVIRRNSGLVASVVAEIGVTALVLVLIWAIFRRAYRSNARYVIRARGVADTCAKCGYDLRRRESDPCCPECGTENRAMGWAAQIERDERDGPA